MTDNARYQAVLDKFEIVEVSSVMLCSRDSGDWTGLAQCFHPDTRVTTSWFDGTASEFAEQANSMMEGDPESAAPFGDLHSNVTHPHDSDGGLKQLRDPFDRGPVRAVVPLRRHDRFQTHLLSDSRHQPQPPGSGF